MRFCKNWRCDTDTEITSLLIVNTLSTSEEEFHAFDSKYVLE